MTSFHNFTYTLRLKQNNLTLRYITLRKTNEEIGQNYYFFADLKEYVKNNLCHHDLYQAPRAFHAVHRLLRHSIQPN